MKARTVEPREAKAQGKRLEVGLPETRRWAHYEARNGDWGMT